MELNKAWKRKKCFYRLLSFEMNFYDLVFFSLIIIATYYLYVLRKFRTKLITVTAFIIWNEKENINSLSTCIYFILEVI